MSAFAQDAAMAVKDGGVFAKGWTGKIDAGSTRQGRVLNDAKFVQEGNALHITTGPATTFWNPTNTASGDYVFGMIEAYLIENGEITEPLREGNLIGNGPKVLQDIDMLGNDFAMGSPGTCGNSANGSSCLRIDVSTNCCRRSR